jgi:prophage regulatory protein
MIIRQKQVLEMTGLSRTTVWRLEKAGTFPKRRKLTGNTVGWLRADVERWVLDLPAVKDCE